MFEFDFTFDKYRKLCSAIQSSAYDTVTLSEYLKQKQNGSLNIILRHDNDHLPKMALRMAGLESEYGIRSTYYFRKKTFKPEISKEIASLGHEVGYHYECLSDAKGDFQKALSIFKDDLSVFREVVEVTSISMHGRTGSPYNNLDMWNHYDFREHGILGEPYLSIDYNSFSYFTDTGRSWNGEKYNIRDVVRIKPKIIVETTDQLIENITARKPGNILLLAHPERWSHNSFYHSGFFVFDMSINFAKMILKNFLKRI